MYGGIWKGKFSEETDMYVSLYAYQSSSRKYYYIESPQYDFAVRKTPRDESAGVMLVISPESLVFWSEEDEST